MEYRTLPHTDLKVSRLSFGTMRFGSQTSEEELRTIARDAGKTLVELSFQWLLGRGIVDSIILGASRPEQLEENLKACEGVPLDAETLARCEAVWKHLRSVTPKYNR